MTLTCGNFWVAVTKLLACDVNDALRRKLDTAGITYSSDHVIIHEQVTTSCKFTAQQFNAAVEFPGTIVALLATATDEMVEILLSVSGTERKLHTCAIDRKITSDSVLIPFCYADFALAVEVQLPTNEKAQVTLHVALNHDN